ncbi:hypothetical protein IFO69_07185 [Echinicola sp. CAU 1574]|uniref:SD-repeat containing protein B domain-containing protein n=1 Tax=Echinicola arenosa TaxID=2774144 RepID=A0ABR9AI54_9BACT|nr:hypothetical protein [Echinicola arenosa]MBD8488520.1 hypothetical protein [Echinicola arenosa]
MEKTTTVNYFQPQLLLSVGLWVLLMAVNAKPALAEGSGDWGTATDRRSWLWVPSNSNTSNTGYGKRGFMLLPSNTSDYNPDHRFFVYVKAGETVHWGFRRNGGNYMKVSWYYDGNDTGFFPTGTTGSGRNLRNSEYYDAGSAAGIQGCPASATEAANGPNTVNASGYNPFSFTNNTGEDRAFWAEISDDSGNILSGGLNISFWDVTVTDASNNVKTGRLYCKFWSIVNGLPGTVGTANTTAFHDGFGFYVPVDDTFGGDGDSYFVKHAQFPNSNGGYVNFFANQDGPRNDTGSHVDNRKSIEGVSTNYQYPLFLNDPDIEFWPTTEVPTASLEITYQERVPTGNGGEAWVDIEISLPGIVDVLIDLNGNGVYDTGVDIVMSESYDAPGEYQVYWDGKDANENIIVSGSEIEVFAAVIFAPVHFPIYDMEQSLGITITNVRPGDPEDNAIYWDDSLIPRDGDSDFSDLGDEDEVSAVSLPVNVTGEAGDSHIWYADGDNGFSQNNTINTWAASYYAEVNESDGYRYLTFQGNVYDDENGLDDELVSGPATIASGLYALIIDEMDKVVASAEVNSDGTYLIDRVPDGSYQVILSTTDAAEGEDSPGPSLPENWENSGEQLGTVVGENLRGSDGVLETFSLNNTSVVNANFGLRTLSILPVQWESFYLNYKNENVELSWSVGREWENSHYIIERSKDGQEGFEEIGKIEAIGWSESSVEYSFKDVQLPISGGRVYYRIKQVDLSGKFSYSKVLGQSVISKTFTKSGWMVYPNPASVDNIRLNYTNEREIIEGTVKVRLVGITKASPYLEANSIEEVNTGVKSLLKGMSKGLLLLEVQWEDYMECIKIIYQ